MPGGGIRRVTVIAIRAETISCAASSGCIRLLPCGDLHHRVDCRLSCAVHRGQAAGAIDVRRPDVVTSLVIECLAIPVHHHRLVPVDATWSFCGSMQVLALAGSVTIARRHLAGGSRSRCRTKQRPWLVPVTASKVWIAALAASRQRPPGVADPWRYCWTKSAAWTFEREIARQASRAAITLADVVCLYWPRLRRTAAVFAAGRPPTLG